MPEQEILVATLVPTSQYPWHINQVMTVGSASIDVLRRNLSLTKSYKAERIPLDGCERVEYAAVRSPGRMVAGVLLMAVVIGIIYGLAVSWADIEPGTRIYVGAIFLAFLYGFRWAFMSKSHRIVFVMRDGRRHVWRSRPGHFAAAQREVARVLEFARERGWMESGAPRELSAAVS